MATYFVSATGHRPDKLGGHWSAFAKAYDKVLADFRAAIRRIVEFESGKGFDKFVFISGIALGIDSIFARAVLLEKEANPDKNILLVAAIPCPEQDKKWSKPLKEEYRKLLKGCDEMKIVSPKYSAKCMQTRNEFMVDHSHMVLAYWDGTPGGTKNCIDYALKRRVVVYNLRDKKYVK